VEFDIARTRKTLFGALLDARDKFGRNKEALEDLERQPITFGRLVLGSLVLGRKLAGLTGEREYVGVLLPNVQAIAVTLFGLNAFGRVPAFLNFTAGLKNLKLACDLAGMRTIITSRRFVEQGKLDDVVEALGEGRRILWLEDVAGAEHLTPERAENLDYVIGVSQWHAENIKEVHPWLPDEKVIGMRNGIRHEFFEGEQPEREPRVLFTSSPDRGLEIVLECWPKILERVPEAKQVKNRVHLDVHVGRDAPEGAAAAEVIRLEGLGATRLHEVDEFGEHWTVMADPEGNEFCVS